MEQNFVEALTLRVENHFVAVLNAKLLPPERKAKQALLDGVRLSGQFSQFVVVEKFDSVNDELITIDSEQPLIEAIGADHVSADIDLTCELAAAAAAKLHFRSSVRPLSIVSNFLHRTFGVQAEVTSHAGSATSFDVNLLRTETERGDLRDLDLKHAYLDAPTVKIILSENSSIQVSLLAAHACVYSEAGKAVVVALRADALSGLKKKNQSHNLNAAAQLTLTALIKHIAASLHIAHAAVQVLLIWPSLDADFKAAEWNNTASIPTLQTSVSAGGLIALAELAAVPGSVVQAMARVLPGVPTRISHANGIVETMASSQGVVRTVRVFPVSHGKLFSLST